MTAISSLNLIVLLGALLVLAGILSSLIALRFGAPLLLVFLFVGVLAGESGPGGIHFDDVRSAYLVGSIALALILFDGGLRTRFQAFRSVMWPSMSLSTIGVLLTAVITAPVAKVVIGLSWTEALLVGAVVSSTDAAAVFLLLHTRGLRLRPRVSALLEIESGTNDPIAIFLTIVLVEILLVGEATGSKIVRLLLGQAVIGALVGYGGGRAIAAALNRLGLQQGLHAPFVTTSALVVFGVAQAMHGSGFLAVYLAGLVVGNRPTRAHNTVISFLDAATWLAQIVMFVLLGLLAWPSQVPQTLGPGLLVALALMFVARPVSVFLCLWPFRFSLREKIFASWVGLRGAVGIFLASIPLLVGLPNAYLFFNIGFVVVVASLLVQAWTITLAARRLGIALPRVDQDAHRVELDLPGQLTQELVGYAIAPNSPYLRRGLLPSWAKPMLVIRDERVLAFEEAGGVREGDYAYFLAPPERAQALDRFFVAQAQAAALDQHMLGDFFIPGDATLGALAEIYGLAIDPAHGDTPLAQHVRTALGRPPAVGDSVRLGPVTLIAHRVADGVVSVVGLQLSEPEPVPAKDAPPPAGWRARIARRLRRFWVAVR